MSEGTEHFYKLSVEIAMRRDLLATDKIVFAVILDRIGKNDSCWPGLRTLAKDTGLTKTATLRSLRRLEKKRILRIERPGSGKVNHYRLEAESGQQTIPVETDKSGQQTIPVETESGQQTIPVETESGQQTIPVNKRYRSTNDTTGGIVTIPEAVNKRYQNQTDPLNQTHITPRNSDELRLASLLFSEIRRRKPDFRKPDLQSWAKHIDKMIRIDRRKPERIEEIIKWAQADKGDGHGWSGWQNNILSTSKLREKFDRLEFGMEKVSGGGTASLVRDAEGFTPRERELERIRGGRK